MHIRNTYRIQQIATKVIAQLYNSPQTVITVYMFWCNTNYEKVLNKENYTQFKIKYHKMKKNGHFFKMIFWSVDNFIFLYLQQYNCCFRTCATIFITKSIDHSREVVLNEILLRESTQHYTLHFYCFIGIFIVYVILSSVNNNKKNLHFQMLVCLILPFQITMMLNMLKA